MGISSKWAKRYWRWHGLCALYSGGFLAFIIITGALAVFAESLYKWEFRDDIRLGAKSELDLSVLPKAFAAAQDEINRSGERGIFVELNLPASPGEALRFSFRNSERSPNAFSLSQPWLSRSVFADPASGAFVGMADDGRSIANYLRLVHVRLFAGALGRNFVGLFGIALFFLCVSGLAILFRFLGKKALWLIRRDTARNLNSDAHKLIGFVFLLPALMFAVTGVWLGLQGRLMQWLDIERPERFEREAVLQAGLDTALPIDFERLMKETRSIYPELKAQRISWSTDGQSTIRIRGRTPGMVYERYSQGIVFDKRDYEPLKIIRTQRAGWGEKLFYLQEALHFGDFGGIALRWAYLLGGLLLGLLPLTGYLIRRLRSRESLGGFYAWSSLGLLYAIGSLVFLKQFGVIATMAYGTVALWTFVCGLAIWWTVRAVKSSRR